MPMIDTLRAKVALPLERGRNSRSTLALLIACCLCVVALAWTGRAGLAQSATTFGPELFTRGPGGKDVFTRTFAVSDPAIPYTLTLGNGQQDGSARVRKGWVTLNGTSLLDPSVFKSQNYILNLAIHPQQQNTIEIKLKGGQPGGSVAVSIRPTDSALLT